jgi:hypothetical protein
MAGTLQITIIMLTCAVMRGNAQEQEQTMPPIVRTTQVQLRMDVAVIPATGISRNVVESHYLKIVAKE